MKDKRASLPNAPISQTPKRPNAQSPNLPNAQSPNLLNAQTPNLPNAQTVPILYSNVKLGCLNKRISRNDFVG